MAKTPDVVAAEILAKLAKTAPGFSLGIGTPERKIVDAVAESISEAYIDQYLVGSLMDIESKAGLELEQWCGIFGFGRMQGRHASGTVRIEMNNSITQDVTVPKNSPFYTRQSLPSSGNQNYFVATQAVIIPAGSYAADIPVEATFPGAAGNVPPDSIVFVSDILGATATTNLQAFTGGVDVETDDELRQRFKDTFLRNVAGTEDFYLGLCYQHNKVSKAACFGPIRKYATQVEAILDVNAYTLTKTGTPTAGNFTLSYGGQTTANIAWNANADAVRDALRLLTNIGSTVGNVTVTAITNGFTIVINNFVSTLTVASGTLTGGAVTVTRNGLNSISYLDRDVKYAWPGDGHVHVFKDLGQSTEKFYRNGIDFRWTPGESPRFVALPGGDIAAGDIVDLEFEYTTQSSRNDPLRGITNKVDLFVNGAVPYTVTERTVLNGTSVLSGTATDQLFTGNFTRVGPSTGSPTAGNRFMRLGSTPIASFPPSLIVGTGSSAQVYTRGTHYHLLRLAPESQDPPNATTLMAGSIHEVVGIEWESMGPVSGTQLTVTYNYNRVPEVLQAMVKTGKQVTTDVLVHQANYAYLRIYLAIEYNRGFAVSQVDSQIQERLRTYFAGLPYGAWIEVSDLSLAVHQVLGVDNVNLVLDDGVSPAHGIKVYATGTDGEAPIITHDTDFKLNDDQLPVFLDAVIRRKANR